MIASKVPIPAALVAASVLLGCSPAAQPSSATPSPFSTTAPPASNGAMPSGSLSDQENSALAVFDLAKASGVDLIADDSFQAMRDGSIFLSKLSLKNDTDATIGFAGDLTILRWTGQKWDQLPCQLVESADERGLCAVHMTNVQTLSAHTTSDPNLTWLGVINGGPGTYALLAPIFRSADEFPTTDATEAAVKIVTATEVR